MKAIANWLQKVASPRSHENHGPEEAKAFAFEETARLPPKQERELLLRAVIMAADAFEAQRCGRLKPEYSSQRSIRKMSSRVADAASLEQKREKRLHRMLQEELVPAAAKSLLLLDDEKDQDELVMVLANAACISDRDVETNVEDLVGCIALLLSNMLLHHGNVPQNGYDARVRHVLKMACVHVLAREMLARLDNKDEALCQFINDDFEKSVNAIFDGRFASAPPIGGTKLQQLSETSSTNVIEQDATSRKEVADCGVEEDVTDSGMQDGTCDSLSEEETNECADLTHDETEIQSSARETSANMEVETTNAIVPADTPSLETDPTEDPNQRRIRFIATRKFEAIEREIATEIFRALVAQQEAREQDEQKSPLSDKDRRAVVRKSVIRGLQIGSVGIVAGTLFAVTGGLAAPALAAGIASIGAVTSSSAVATFAILTTVKAAAAVFGVGGGGLAAYKMKKRTQGLSEFRIRRENIEQNAYLGASDESLRKVVKASLPQLHTTICVSGWLREKYKGADFQAAWGVQPTDPPIASKLELLKRLYAVYAPEKLKTCQADIKERKSLERKEFSWDRVWEEIKERYGCTPDHLLPLEHRDENGTVKPMSLSREEEATINNILYKVVLKQRHGVSTVYTPPSSPSIASVYTSPRREEMEEEKLYQASSEGTSASLTASEADDADQAESQQDDSLTQKGQQRQVKETEERLVVWDWETIYGSDLHTITWETDVLRNMCHIASSMTKEMTTQATKFALQYSAFVGAVLAAVAVPSALLTATHVIDDPYQIVILRADEAGKELAKCLLQSEQKRPVTLVGFSFGARVIYACLMELARLQDLWDDQQEHQENQSVGTEQKITREPTSVVEDVVLMGLPRGIDSRNLRRVSNVAAGRFVNCFTKNDWVLTLMFLCRGTIETCGTHPIRNIPGIENYNVTDLVEAHSKFSDGVPMILKRVGLGEPKSLSN